MQKNQISIVIPTYFKIIVLKKENLLAVFINSKKIFCCFWLKKENIFFSKNMHGFNIKLSNKYSKENIKHLEHCAYMLIKGWEIYFYKKFKFKSKGLKIKRKRRKKKYLKFFFWLSHMHITNVKKCKLRRIGKQKYIFICSNWKYLTDICKRMRRIRKNDLFTKKGIRFGRQIVLKKRGKKVTYI